MISYKGYYIKKEEKLPNSFVIVTEGRGGKIPNVLGGMFTSVGVAQKMIDRYLNTKPVVKEKPDGNKTIAKSGD